MKKIYIFIIFLISICGFAQEQTMYWIGGAGNWDDLSHWSFQSGSQDPNLQPSSIPNADTHVIFDINSGLTGTGNQPTRNVNVRFNSRVKSLTFTSDLDSNNSPKITINYNLTLGVRENIILQPNVTITGAGELLSTPNMGETAQVWFNAAEIAKFAKTGLGLTLIKDAFPSTINLKLSEGTTQYDLPEITIGELNLTGIFNLPNTTIFNLTKLDNRHDTTNNGQLILPLNVVITTNTWIFNGIFNAPLSILNIEGIEFNIKSGTSSYNIVNLNNDLVRSPIGSFNGKVKVLNFNGSEYNLRGFGNYVIEKLRVKPNAIIKIEIDTKIEILDSIEYIEINCDSYFIIEASGYNDGTFINSTGAELNVPNMIARRVNFLNPNNNNTKIAYGIANSGAVTYNNIPAAKNFYWIGGITSNEWNDPSNWSNTPNGSPGSCLPTSFDDVFINSNLPLQINVTDLTAFAHNVSINTPELVLSGLDLNVTGSWEMSANSEIESTVFFSSDFNNNEITSNGSVFHELTFFGKGTWTLQDDLQTAQAKNLTFHGGTINTNEKNIYLGGDFLGGWHEYGAYIQILNMQKSTISVQERFWFSSREQQIILFADQPGSHIILRNGNELKLQNPTIDKVTVHDISVDNSNKLLVEYRDTTINELTIESAVSNLNYPLGSPDFLLTVGIFKCTPPADAPLLNINSNVTVNSIQIGKQGRLLFTDGRTFTVNNQFISNTGDCDGLMELGIIEKTEGQFINFIAEQNILIKNIFINGVKAADNGVTYQIQGVVSSDSSGFDIIELPSFDLYWIGTNSNNWNDPLNWTTDPTGQTAMNQCIPDPFDNVHFESFSGNNGLTININNSSAYFKNFYASNAPAGMVFTGNDINAFGDTVEFGQDSNLNLKLIHHGTDTSLTTIKGPVQGTVQVKDLVMQPSIANHIFNFENNLKVNGNLIINGGEINMNLSAFSVSNIFQNKPSVFNAPDVLTVGYYEFSMGEFNGRGNILNINHLNSNNGKIRHLNITNATLNIALYRFTAVNATLSAIGSTINISNLFFANSDHIFNKVEIVGENATIDADNTYIKELLVSKSAAVINNLKVNKLFIAPNNLTLTLKNGMTLTVEDELFTNGTPCQINTIIGTAGNNAKIAYANPNNQNEFDFVNMRYIDAIDADLIFQVNSVVQQCNNKVIKVNGNIGLIGLGSDENCRESYVISASEFYGGPLSTYVWYKKNEQGEFVNLNLPTDTIEINALNYGLDGEYKVTVVYDATLPHNEQCTISDTVTYTFLPINVGFENNPVNFCEEEEVTLEDIYLNDATLDFIEEFNPELKWYMSATGGNSLANNTQLVNGSTYYASLLTVNNCESKERTPVTIQVNEKPIANAGSDQYSTTQTQFVMNANNPLIGTGKWTVVSGDVTIANPTMYNTLVTINSGEFAELEWEVDNNGCTSADNVFIGYNFIDSEPSRINPSMRMRVSQ
nr:hypothetical protein [uncultured Flavobacterium sp.]